MIEPGDATKEVAASHAMRTCEETMVDHALSQDTQMRIRRLEESLWQEGSRFDRDYMTSILADDFVEFGRSGRCYDRQAVLAVTPGALEAEIPLPNLQIRVISATVLLVTYDSRVAVEGRVQSAHRSSLWSLEAGGWRLRFHQGTPF